jgi:hypothetical protein
MFKNIKRRRPSLCKNCRANGKKEGRNERERQMGQGGIEPAYDVHSSVEVGILIITVGICQRLRE